MRWHLPRVARRLPLLTSELSSEIARAATTPFPTWMRLVNTRNGAVASFQNARPGKRESGQAAESLRLIASNCTLCPPTAVSSSPVQS